MTFSIEGDEPILACPKCKSRQYAILMEDNMCRCDNCGCFASTEFFELEGEKWDNYETANCY